MYNEKYKGHKINIEKEKFMSKMTKTIAALGVVAGLGVAALPLSSYATIVSGNTTVTAQAIIGEAISVTADATDDIVKIENVTANQDVAEGSTNVTVQTNNANGYNVVIEDKDATTALMTTDGSGTATGIPAGVPVKGTNAWGFKASAADGSSVTIPTAAQSYRAIEANGSQLALANRVSGATDTDGDVFTLTFGVTVDSSIAAGTYQDEVIITATTRS